MLRLSTFFSDVLGTVLTGVSTASSAALAASDSILVALGKLQAQNTAEVTARNNATQGYTTVAVAAGTITPSAAVFSAYAILSFTGSLTANAIVIVPNTGAWVFINNTTGAYTLQFKTSAGTGIFITQGQSMDVVANGTNLSQSPSDFLTSPVFSGNPTRASGPALGDASTALATSLFAGTLTQGATTVGLSGGAYTPTTAITCFPQITLAGALTSNLVVTLPSTGQWTIANATTGAFTVALKTAAQTAPLYLAQGASLRVIANSTNVVPADSDFQNSPLSPANCIGRNLLHNPLFMVAQRGVGPWTTTAYGIDRWQTVANNATGSISTTQIALADADRTAIGDEAAENALQSVVVGGTAAADSNYALQRIEDARVLGGKTVTVSLWAKANVASIKLGIGGVVSYGTGGSPSANALLPSTSVTLTTSWARYSLTLLIPTSIGKTLGTTANTSYTEIDFGFSSGTTNAAQLGTPGVQSATFTLWGAQVEVGPTATPLEKRNGQIELALCQRFFQQTLARCDGYQTAGGVVNQSYLYPVAMRAIPTVAFASTAYSNASGLVLGTSTLSLVNLSVTATATGGVGSVTNLTASAEQ